MKWWRSIVAVFLTLGILAPESLLAAYPTSKSSSYGITEDEIGIGGDITSNSSSYSSGGSTLGDTAVGNSGSTNYQTGSGFNTTDDPSLAFNVLTPTVNLGTLSSSIASTGTASFNAKNYTSYGYAITIVGLTLKSGASSIAALATDTASAAGTPQFGVNTVANTSPVTVGANPVENPGASFSYGVAGNGVTGTFGTTRPYTIPNNYRFVTGETVASAPKTSGQTDYTMSFLANIAPLTPGGTYTSNLVLICTGTY